MVQNGDFQELGERIMEDKRYLNVIIQERPHEQIEMRSLIKLVEKEWLFELFFDETRKERRLKFILLDKGSEKLRSLVPPLS